VRPAGVPLPLLLPSLPGEEGRTSALAAGAQRAKR